MNGVELRLLDGVDRDIDMSELLPQNLLGQTLAQVQKMRIPYGGRMRKLADVFEIATNKGEALCIRDATPVLGRIGKGLTGGQIKVYGDTGPELGVDMRSGAIEVRGNVGDFLASGMRGGTIVVSGSCGDSAGGALPGAPMGQRGGLVRIGKNAGVRAGDRMRRGCLVIAGNVDSYCASAMIAGSVIVGGDCAQEIGIGMRRGTVLLLKRPSRLPATFNPCGEFSLSIMQLLANHVASTDRSMAKKIRQLDLVQRFVGDLGAGGQGEILVAAAT